MQDSAPDAFAPKMPVYKPGEKERIDALQQSIQSAKDSAGSKADSLSAGTTGNGRRSILARAAAGDLAWKFPIPTAVSATKCQALRANQGLG